jgi:hypothetical protein
VKGRAFTVTLAFIGGTHLSAASSALGGMRSQIGMSSSVAFG